MDNEPDRRPGARRLPAILLLAAGALVLGTGVLVLLLTGQSVGGGGVATSPQILVDRTEIDFGQVPVNQRVRADFTITNAGGRPLQIVGQPQVDVVKGC